MSRVLWAFSALPPPFCDSVLPMGTLQSSQPDPGLISAMRVLFHLPVLLASLSLFQVVESDTNGKYHLVLVSWGCCNKGPQTGWLKTTEIYSPTVQEAGSPKSRCWLGHAPLKALGQNHSLPLPASGSSQQPLAYMCITPISASIFTRASSLWCPLCVLSSCYKTTSHWI